MTPALLISGPLFPKIRSWIGNFLAWVIVLRKTVHKPNSKVEDQMRPLEYEIKPILEWI